MVCSANRSTTLTHATGLRTKACQQLLMQQQVVRGKPIHIDNITACAAMPCIDD